MLQKKNFQQNGAKGARTHTSTSTSELVAEAFANHLIM
jgi:hypothetical protein